MKCGDAGQTILWCRRNMSTCWGRCGKSHGVFE